MQIVEAPTKHQITNMQQKIKNLMICWQMRKTSYKAKTLSSEFKVITPNNSLINNLAITNMMRNLTTYPSLSQNINL